MQIHIARDGKQFGPYSVAEVNDYLGTGFLKPDDIAWHEGMAEWAPLNTIQGVNAPQGARRPPPPSRPTPPYGSAPAGVKPETYLVSAILATLFCCLPFGVVSIVYAAQVDSKWNAGDQTGAHESSKKAKLWYHVSLLTGLAIVGIWFLFAVLAAAFRH